MANKRITTELVVKAVDQYSSMIRNMSGVTGRFARTVRTEMGQLQGLRGPLRLIDDFRRQQAVVRVSAGALDAANEKTRQLLTTIRATPNPTAAMRREFERARATAGRLEEKHRRNRVELRGLQVQMQSAGVDTSDLSGEQRRLAGALDTANDQFARQAERMQRLKVMQDRISESRERMNRSLATAANLSFVGNASMGVGRRILASTEDVADRSGNQQESFTEFQNLTGVDDARISQLRGELSALRDVTKQSVDEMLAGLGVLVGKGMDLEDALGALPATARAAFATDTSSDEMGGAGFALYDNLGISPDDLRSAYDIMAMGGKEGGFELSAMARSFPEITAGARSLGMSGLGSVAELTAALQVAMKSAGSESQAATNLSNFLGKLTSPATVRKFAEVGISIEEELQKAMERGVSPMEHMLDVIAEQTGGNALKMGELFEDKQVLDFLRAMIPNMEEYARIRDTAMGADGVVDVDLDRRLRDFNVQRRQLGESLGNLFTLPPEALDTLTAMLERADAFVEKLIVWKNENPGFAKGLFLGATALGAMAVAGGALLVSASGLIGTMAVLRFGLVGLGARGAFAAGEIGMLRSGFRGLRGMGRFALSGLIAPLRWTARLLPAVPWARLAGGLRWSSLITPLAWVGRGALRFIPVIGWAALAGELAWRLLIKPLGWDQYLPSIDWKRIWNAFSWEGWLPEVDWSEFLDAIDWPDWVDGLTWSSFIPNIDWSYWFGFQWIDHLPTWSWDFIPTLNIGEKIVGFGSGWANSIEPGSIVGRTVPPEDVGANTYVPPSARMPQYPGMSGLPPQMQGLQRRALGGSARGGLPYFVNEQTPRSEIFVPSTSGGILNVGQAQSAFMSYFGSGGGQGAGVARSAQRVRSASLASLAATAITLAPQVAAAPVVSAGDATPKSSEPVRVEIGSIHIVAPSGVSDPEGLVDLLERRLGERLNAINSASYSS